MVLVFVPRRDEFFFHSGLLLRRRRCNSGVPLGSLKRSRRVFDYTLDVFMRCLCVFGRVRGIPFNYLAELRAVSDFASQS